MSLEVTRPEVSLRDPTIATELRAPIHAIRTKEIALRRGGFSGTGETPISNDLAVYYRHALIQIGVRANFETGTLNVVIQKANSRGIYEDLPTQGRVLYRSSAYAGASPTQENLADFLAEAARELDDHETGVRNARARFLPLVLQ